MLFCPLYRKLYADANLNRAWRSVRRQSKSAGVDAMSASQFDSKAFVYLKRLQEELRRRTYRPGAVKRIFMRREVGPPRELGILSIRDRIVQRALAQTLIPIFDPHFDDYSHAYRTGRSPQTAIAQLRQHALAGRPWLVKIDLSDCFGTIPHRPMLRLVRRRVRDLAVYNLLKRLLDVPVITESRSGAQQIAKSKGLLQGSPLSPLLANIYLDKFDKAARSRDLHFVRYGDDIAIVTASRQEAEQARDVAIQMLERLRLQINRDKTRLYNLARGCNYLGEWMALEKVHDGQWQINGK